MHEYREFPPPPRLASSVECFWASSAGAGGETAKHRVMPDGSMDIIFRVSGGRAALYAAGTMSRAETFEVANDSEFCAVRFHPAMSRAFLKAPGPQLLDTTVPLEDLWRPAAARELCRRLGNARTVQDRLRIMGGSLETVDPAHGPVQRAAAAIRQGSGVVSVDELAREAGLSARQLRRLMIDETGVGPKMLARILRFRRAAAIAAREVRGWADIAAECGYFDQAHLVRDFREFAGVAPMAVFSKTS
jgi:AraC-like DNA-binding protein